MAWTNPKYAAMARAIEAMAPGDILPLAKDGKSYICPNCQAGTGKNGKGTGIKFFTDRYPHFHCFACGCHGDMVSIAALNLGIKEQGAAQLKAVCHHFNIGG